MVMVGFLSRNQWSYSVDGSSGCLEFLALTQNNQNLSPFNHCINSQMVLIESTPNLISFYVSVTKRKSIRNVGGSQRNKGRQKTQPRTTCEQKICPVVEAWVGGIHSIIHGLV